MTTMHHGTRRKFARHIGLCLTDDESSAAAYGQGGEVVTVEIDLSSLVVERVADFRVDDVTADGDAVESIERYAARGVDVLRYEDQDPAGRTHTTWRLVSARALASVSVVEAAYEDEDEDEEV